MNDSFGDGTNVESWLSPGTQVELSCYSSLGFALSVSNMEACGSMRSKDSSSRVKDSIYLLTDLAVSYPL